MRQPICALVAVASLATAACFNIEQTLTFEKDLSGTAGFSMKIDLEPIVGFMAMMKHSMTGKQGAPSAADIAEARKELLASAKKDKPTDFEKEKQELQSKLPAGVKLLDATFKEDGLTIAANIKLGFDQASKLSAIKLDQKPGAAPVENPMESPFGGLQVVDEGKTVLITSPALNPVGEQKEQLGQMPGMDAAMKAQFEGMLKGLRVAFRITSPLEVVEHNAHRKEGNTLIWDYNLASLEKLSKEQMTQGIRARYRK